MSSLGPPRAEPALPADVRRQVRRIQQSKPFSASDALRKLLDFLTDQFEHNPDQPVKETEIAISVFNRKSDFDPHTDSVVRVQTARLRAKLLEYYTSEGQQDELILDIPKGAYRLVCAVRQPVATPEPPPEPIPIPEPRRANLRWWGAGTAAALLVGILIGFLIARRDQPATAVDPAVEAFWRDVLPGNTAPIAVFANPRLAGTLANNNLVYYNEELHAKDPTAENYSYTGVGDLMSVHVLTRLFTRIGYDLEAHPPSNLSWDGARERNLIFVGRPEQNPALRELPELESFRFRFRVGIVNTQPRPGESQIYASGPRPNTYDYAVIGYTPGLRPDRRFLIFGGTLSYGTQAAVEYLCRPDSVRELLAKLGTTPGARIPYFEALIYTHISKGVPLRSRLLIVRNRGFDLPSWSPPASEAR